jgi:hypothetical protein
VDDADLDQESIEPTLPPREDEQALRREDGAQGDRQTVNVPKGKAGIAAVDLMWRSLAASGDGQPEQVELPTGLVVRGSTGVAPTR